MAEEKQDLIPLENVWVLWEHGGSNQSNWKDHMKQLGSFSTVQDFWRYINHVPKPSQIFYDGDSKKRVGPDKKTVASFSLFKRGIVPEWEDAMNLTGGEWYIRSTLESDVLNAYWQNLIIAVVGETMEPGKIGQDVINGARVVDKGRVGGIAMFRLELWIRSRDNDVKEKVRAKLVEMITDGVPPNRKGPPKFEWKDHS